MPGLKTAPEQANPVNADRMAKLGSDGERPAGLLAALLDLAQLDESGGQVGQGGAAVPPERRVQPVQCSRQGGKSIPRSVELEVADAVVRR
jgi:hypothetical protein